MKPVLSQQTKFASEKKESAGKISTTNFIPPHANWEKLYQASKKCKGCELYRHATQTVFGEGNSSAKVFLIGEAPGNLEDKKGRPFVGPAGNLLNKAIEEAGLRRPDVYITNAVKHFKFLKTRHYRLGLRPSLSQINACRPWLDAELTLIKPKIVVCLGAVAARSVLGKSVVIKKERGSLINHSFGTKLLITSHPSAILRTPNKRAEEYQRFVRDLKIIRKFLVSNQ